MPSTQNTLPLTSTQANPEVSSSDHLINRSFTAVFIRTQLVCPFFERFLDRTKPGQSEAQQSPVTLTCTILLVSHLKVFRSLIIELDPIQRRNLGHRHAVTVK